METIKNGWNLEMLRTMLSLRPCGDPIRKFRIVHNSKALVVTWVARARENIGGCASESTERTKNLS